ncbi:MAG: 23S rRNA (uracil(1939)-C(5))-methyltransferase RlmD [Hydrogenoanaerobacterium sp.]
MCKTYLKKLVSRIFKKNDIVEMAITDITDEGNGVGKIDGFTVFVPESAVGDVLRVRLVKLQKSFGYGICEEILTPSKSRVTPDCPVYHSCGGCSLRHISYESELVIKENWVRQHLKRIAGLTVPLLPIIPSPKAEGYRNKAQYPIRRENDAVLLGMFSKRSHRVIQCTDCKLQPAGFEEILKTVQTFCLEYEISVYNEDKHTGLLRHVYIRTADATNETMLCLVINGEELPHSDILIQRICANCHGVTSIILNINKGFTNVILGDTCKTLFGTPRINDILCGLKISLSPLSFYQVNRDGAQCLYGVIKEFANLSGSETLLDLYCGAGTIGLSLARNLKELIGVEIIEQAVENAKKNAKENGISNAHFFCDDATGAAQKLHDKGVCPDIIILDPPRKGCAPEVLSAVSSMKPSRIIMVSCNSATLARDLLILTQQGYTAVKAQPVDMFPRTAHVEAIILMTYCGDKPKK